MPQPKSLYDTDFLAWSRQQAEALRAAIRDGSNQRLDWGNLAEEIEDLGISQRSALGSQIRRIIRHLLELQYSPAGRPRRGWEDSIADARIEVEDLLERSPSLAREVVSEIVRQTRHAVRLALRDLEGMARPMRQWLRRCARPSTPKGRCWAIGFRRAGQAISLRFLLSEARTLQ